VLLALPALTGGTLSRERLRETAAGLGSDVNFFLEGGTAAAIGRGTELFPLPDGPPRAAWRRRRRCSRRRNLALSSGLPELIAIK
jgi:4-diphosphocytidyl-2C-methyl-D-erythritol kinase